MPAPEIAKDYWRLDSNATMLDVIYAVRSDESTHRFVNHSLANLNNKTDINPFALREPDMHVKGTKPGYVLPASFGQCLSYAYIISFDREESAQYVRESRELLHKQA